MQDNLNYFSYLKRGASNFFTGLFNFFIFLPYFFSVLQLLRTLFNPWKNLITNKTKPGFSFEEWASRIGFNLISRSIGFIMRAGVVAAYFVTVILFVLMLPVFIIGYFLLTPFLYFIFLFRKTKEEKKAILKKWFMKTHLLEQESIEKVERWFEIYYLIKIKKSSWWQISSLFSALPLARDWSVGYTPTLDKYSDELTTAKAHFKNLINREKEIKQIEGILSKTGKANVLIVGEEGVGKHTIIEGLAKRIFEGGVNQALAYKRIIKLDLEKILSESADISQKEEILKTLLKEAEAAKNIIILIDDFDKYISGAEGRINLTTAINSFASSADLQFIGITSPFFYQKIIFPNEKMNRAFEKVDVFEIKVQEAEEILLRIAFEFEDRFRLIIPYETICEVIQKSSFYITYIPFPEKAIELLDEACVYTTQSAKKTDSKIVTPEIVDAVLTQKTHVPVRLNQSMKDKLLNLEALLKNRIVFQDEPIEKLSSAMRKSFTLASSRKKPLASFLFLGPTGVGKTETAKTLSEAFFGSLEHLIRFDMSFYQTKNDIANLIGSADAKNPGILTTAVREKPYGVLLLDEIEKAHSDLLNIFLTVLDEGYFIDGYGKRVDCKNIIIIATSNAGSDFIFQKIGTTSGLSLQEQLIDYLIKNKSFTPEFLNRFDGVIIYRVLSKEAIIKIAKKMLVKIAGEIYRSYKIKITISNEFFESLIQKGYNPQFGARNMERVIRDEVEDKIAQLILGNKIKSGEIIKF